MTDTEFLDRAETVLSTIEACCDRINDETDADIDNQRVGSMITLVFPNHSQLVVNLQKPLQEIWLAARAGGFHFKWDGAVWRDTKTGAEFVALFNEQASGQARKTLVLE